MTLILPNAAIEFTEALGEGYLGVFYFNSNGDLICSGSTYMNGQETAFPAMGDDATTDEIDGLVTNQEFLWIYTLDNGEKAPFFIGTENTMLFITETPILQDSPLAIAMLYIDKKRIYYCEVTFGSQALTSLKSTIPCEEKIEYLNVENAKFSYFVWKDYL
jgi:hypothetical protein